MRPLKGGVLAAYTVVSIIWGSTYLAIRIGVSRTPPALFGAIRFLTAGTLLLVLSLALGKRLPRRGRDWVTAAVVGIMLLALGNGLVIWAEQSVESGTAAILVVTGALMMAAFDAVIPGSVARPNWRQFVALFVGFGGVVLLVGGNPGALGEAGWLGPAAVVLAAASWSVGSIFSKRRPVDTSPYVFSALQMLFGGGTLLVIGLASGEAAQLTFTASGFGAVLYLIVFGSIVAYTSYVYLLRQAAPAFVGTTVYVNTVVAVLLGWLVLSEHVSLRTFAAMAVILGSVIWVRRAEPAPAPLQQKIEEGP